MCTAAARSRRELLEELGDPSAVADGLRSFTASNVALSRRHEQLVERCADRWVAFVAGELYADATSLAELLARLAALGPAAQHASVHRVELTPRKMILAAC